jgi:hypothetical protein
MVRATHHLNRQEVEDKRPWFLMWCFVVLLCMEVYSIFKTSPQGHGFIIVSDEEVEMFLADPQKISFQSWVDYAAIRVAICIAFNIIWSLAPAKYYTVMEIFFWLAVGYLIDYFVFYNNPVARVGPIPISYTLFMLSLGGWLVIKALIKWR